MVLAKLLGLVQLYLALVGLTQGAGMIAMLSSGGYPSPRELLVSMIAMGAYLAVSLAIVWVLLAKTEWLAMRVGLKEEAPVAGLERVPALQTGVTLIGVFVTANSLPPLLRILLQSGFFMREPILPSSGVYLIPVVFQTLLGLFLALRPRTVVALIDREAPARRPRRTECPPT